MTSPIINATSITNVSASLSNAFIGGEEIDNFIVPLLDRYVETILMHETINKSLTKKKIRNENFPSHLSENIVKVCLNKLVYSDSVIKVSWNTAVGDLQFGSDKLEVKAFSSTGPSSFGPEESWTKLYFLDATNVTEKKFKVYEVDLKNTDDQWQNIKVNASQTYRDQCVEGRRPRFNFKHLQKHLPEEHIVLLFDGHISELF
jgi:hypothetical protein